MQFVNQNIDLILCYVNYENKNQFPTNLKAYWSQKHRDAQTVSGKFLINYQQNTVSWKEDILAFRWHWWRQDALAVWKK